LKKEIERMTEDDKEIIYEINESKKLIYKCDEKEL